jgi:hypothetical protein
MNISSSVAEHGFLEVGVDRFPAEPDLPLKPGHFF